MRFCVSAPTTYDEIEAKHTDLAAYLNGKNYSDSIVFNMYWKSDDGNTVFRQIFNYVNLYRDWKKSNDF